MGIVADQFKNAEWGVRTRELANEIVKDMSAMRREVESLRAENERLKADNVSLERSLLQRAGNDYISLLRERDTMKQQLEQAREALNDARFGLVLVQQHIDAASELYTSVTELLGGIKDIAKHTLNVSALEGKP